MDCRPRAVFRARRFFLPAFKFGTALSHYACGSFAFVRLYPPEKRAYRISLLDYAFNRPRHYDYYADGVPVCLAKPAGRRADSQLHLRRGGRAFVHHRACVRAVFKAAKSACDCARQSGNETANGFAKTVGRKNGDGLQPYPRPAARLKKSPALFKRAFAKRRLRRRAGVFKNHAVRH